jgi:hypothetical protein
MGILAGVVMATAIPDLSGAWADAIRRLCNAGTSYARNVGTGGGHYDAVRWRKLLARCRELADIEERCVYPKSLVDEIGLGDEQREVRLAALHLIRTGRTGHAAAELRLKSMCRRLADAT